MSAIEIKEFRFSILFKNRTVTETHSGAITAKKLQSEEEARQAVEDWIRKTYPGSKVQDLEITLRQSLGH